MDLKEACEQLEASRKVISEEAEKMKEVYYELESLFNTNIDVAEAVRESLYESGMHLGGAMQVLADAGLAPNKGE